MGHGLWGDDSRTASCGLPVTDRWDERTERRADCELQAASYRLRVADRWERIDGMRAQRRADGRRHPVGQDLQPAHSGVRHTPRVPRPRDGIRPRHTATPRDRPGTSRVTRRRAARRDPADLRTLCVGKSTGHQRFLTRVAGSQLESGGATAMRVAHSRPSRRRCRTTAACGLRAVHAGYRDGTVRSRRVAARRVPMHGACAAVVSLVAAWGAVGRREGVCGGVYGLRHTAGLCGPPHAVWGGCGLQRLVAASRHRFRCLRLPRFRRGWCRR